MNTLPKGLLRLWLCGEVKALGEWLLHCTGHNLCKLHGAGKLQRAAGTGAKSAEPSRDRAPALLKGCWNGVRAFLSVLRPRFEGSLVITETGC